MKDEIELTITFVEFIPEELAERTLYISKKYETAIHKCACGCNREVVTPLSGTGWKIRYEKDLVSLYPSIGSWSLPCRSHYWIRNSKIVWAEDWSEEQVERGRAAEAQATQSYYDSTPSVDQPENPIEPMHQGPGKLSLLRRFWIWITKG